jgi:hypothetical protein
MGGEETATVWYQVAIPEDIDLGLPGIYQWDIEGVGTYIGQSKNLRKRLWEYPNNLRKLAQGKPYRKSKPDAWRHIHLKLHDARTRGVGVTVTVIENCPLDELNERERHWIGLRGTLNR